MIEEGSAGLGSPDNIEEGGNQQTPSIVNDVNINNTSVYLTLEEKDILIQKQIAGLTDGTINPEFALKKVSEVDLERETQKKYFDRYLAGEVTEDEMRIFDGDWLLALKEKDRKKSRDFIDNESWKERRDAISVHWNRPLTDLGNAERLVDQYGTLILYCHEMREWYVWMYDEGRWKLDKNGFVVRMCKDVVRRIYHESSIAPTEDTRKKMWAWANQCECKTHLTGMNDLAQSDKKILVSPDEFDKNDMLFNLRNGTFNLETLVLEPHNKKNNISKYSDFAYNPKATCPKFEIYLDRIFRSASNKTEIIKFLQRAVGYTLTGLTQEECLFLPYGKGSNGKSVFLEILHALMGEYGTTINSRSLTTERGEQTNDLAALVGKRYVSSSENSEGSKLDAELIKKLTGKDLISARFLYKEPFDFKPKFKLWWAFNHPPEISDQTNSIWRRVKIIPYTETIPEREMNKRLADEIIATELSGVFNWAVAGLAEYNLHGLQQPEIITESTKQYKNDQDILLDFFNSNYEITEDLNDKVKASDLYASYKAWWYSIESTKPLSSTKFGRLCRDRGLDKKDERVGSNHGTYYSKIRSIHQSFLQK